MRQSNFRHASACRRVAADSTAVRPSNDETLAGWEGWLAPAQDAAPLKQPETREPNALACRDEPDDQPLSYTDKPRQNLLLDAVVDIHRRWLMTPRDDLKSQSRREVLFAKRDLIDSDLESRMNQWSYFLEEPPCLSRDSDAYRFAGFGTHEWVMYYDLVRFLIWQAVDLMTNLPFSRSSSENHLSFTPGFSLGQATPNDQKPFQRFTGSRL